VPDKVEGTRLKLQLVQPDRRGQGRQVKVADLLINPALPPNLSHPLANLSPTSREATRINDLATVLASIASRKARRLHHPPEESHA